MRTLKQCILFSHLRFTDILEIYSMISDDTEEIILKDIISTAAARGCVEKWLVQVKSFTQNIRKYNKI
jgi:dynein heavy chain